MIAAGADINHQDACGDTPAMEAASSRRYRIVYTLLQAGADWKIKESNGHDLARICYVSPQDLKNEFPEGYEYNQKVLGFLEKKGVDLVSVKKEVHKFMGWDKKK